MDANEAAVLDELLGSLRTAMDPYFGESDPTVYMGMFSDVATYFDPNTSGKLADDGIRQLFGAYAGQIPPDRYEITNPGVSLHGETAVFTFNLNTFSKTDGSVTSRWNTTQIHTRTAEGWDMVHAHWSHTGPATG